MTKESTFEYLLVRLADWFIEQNALNSYTEFDLNNDFGESKLKLLPFIICTANGKRKDLFGRFNNWKADDDGNIEQNLLNYMSHIFSTGLFNTTFTNAEITNSNRNILDETLLPILGVEMPLNSEDNAVIDGIKNSITHIKDVLNLPELINYSTDELSAIHKRQSSWRTFHSLPSVIFENLGGSIPIDFLIAEKSLLAHSPEKRIFA